MLPAEFSPSKSGIDEDSVPPPVKTPDVCGDVPNFMDMQPTAQLMAVR